MKKQIWTVALAMVGLFCTQTVHAQAFEKGKTYVSVAYGLVHAGTINKMRAYKRNEGVQITKNLRIPIAVQAEYGLSNRWGVGISSTFEKYVLNYSSDDVFGGERVKSEDKIGIFSLNARANYHFGKAQSAFDPYVGAGVGVTHFLYQPAEWFSIKDNMLLGEFRVGSRYFFTKNIAAQLEIGLGSIFIHAGLTAKF